MGIWIVEDGKLRPSYPECSFKVGRGTDETCGGETAPITFPPWECGTLIQRINSSTTDCCNDNVQLQCKSCDMVACEPCMEGKWTDR